LSDEVRESCHPPCCSQVLVLTQEESPNPFRLSVEVGSTHSPLRTNSGRLLLAGLSPAAFDAWLAHSREWQGMAPAAREDLLARIADVRARGHARSLGERFLGGADIGVLVGTPGAPLNAALTIATLIDANGDARLDPLLAPLQRTAAAISHAAGLGLDGGPLANAVDAPASGPGPGQSPQDQQDNDRRDHDRQAHCCTRPARGTPADGGKPACGGRDGQQLGSRMVQRAVRADCRAAGRHPGDLCQPDGAPDPARGCHRQRHPPQADQRAGHCPGADRRGARGAGRCRGTPGAGQRPRGDLAGGAEAWLPTGAPLLSDAVPLPITALQHLAISVYYKDSAMPAAHHADLVVAPGDQLAAASMAGARAARPGGGVASGSGAAPARPGDRGVRGSITEGAASTPGKDMSWPQQFAKRLAADPRYRGWSVVNAGMSGNRLLHECLACPPWRGWTATPWR
jgi:hypothetical protein